MKKKLQAAFYTFLVLLVIGLLVICGRIYPHETGLIITFLWLCASAYAIYYVILELID
jgi:hypothetical protein